MRLLIFLFLLFAITFSTPIQYIGYDGWGNATYIGNNYFITATHCITDDKFIAYDGWNMKLYTITEVYDLEDDMSLVKVNEKVNLKPTPISSYNNSLNLVMKGYYNQSYFEVKINVEEIGFINPMEGIESGLWIKFTNALLRGMSGSGIYERNKLVGVLSCGIVNKYIGYATMITKEKEEKICYYLKK